MVMPSPFTETPRFSKELPSVLKEVLVEAWGGLDCESCPFELVDGGC